MIVNDTAPIANNLNLNFVATLTIIHLTYPVLVISPSVNDLFMYTLETFLKKEMSGSE